MKIITEKQLLANAMKKAAKIASPRASLPILSHVAVSFDGEMCAITANDSARTYSEKFPASGEPGQCTIEADKLLKAVNGMSAGEIELTDGQIRQGRSKLKLETRNYADFPQPDYDDAKPCGLTGDVLEDLIGIVGHAVPAKDVRPMLNGVHLEAGHCVATDGHRMAWADCDYDGPDLIIPAESIRQMVGIGGTISVSDRQLIIESDCARFSTNLVDAKYPDWRRIVPREFAATATVGADDLITALKTAQIGGDIARLAFADGQCHISNDKAESACDAQFDADITVGVFIQYLIDAVTASASDSVTIGLNTSRPGLLVNDRFTIMPVRF